MNALLKPTTESEAVDTLMAASTLQKLLGTSAGAKVWPAVRTAAAILAPLVPPHPLTTQDIADVLAWGIAPGKASAVDEYLNECVARRDAGALNTSTPPATGVANPTRI